MILEYVIENVLFYQEGGCDRVIIQDATPGQLVTFQALTWMAALARVARKCHKYD